MKLGPITCRVAGKGGQSAVEASMLVAIMSVFLLSFLVALGDRGVEAEKKMFESEVEDLAKFISTEVQLAQASEANYARNFSVPSDIRGRNYSLSFYTSAQLYGTNMSAVVIKTNPPFEIEKMVMLPKNVVRGELCKGYNVVSKNAEGEISIVCSGG